jgi:hypothetical protein
VDQDCERVVDTQARGNLQNQDLWSSSPPNALPLHLVDPRHCTTRCESRLTMRQRTPGSVLTALAQWSW